MKCSKMKLGDRREAREQRKGNTGCDVCGDLTNQHNFEIKSFASWPGKTLSRGRSSASLTISELVLPSNFIPQMTPGAQRWINRRPRLRSSHSSAPQLRPNIEHVQAPQEPVSLQQHVSKEEINYEYSSDSEITHVRLIVAEYEIDENVQKLIEEAGEYDRVITSAEKGEEVYRTRKKKKRKKRKKSVPRSDIAELDRRGITKHITLSRPVSPETEQVIRVDVVSSFSVEDAVDSDLSVAGTASSKLTATNPRITIKPKGTETIQDPDLTVRCEKLRLSCRKMEIPSTSKRANHMSSKHITLKE